jgi:hypothetical protein
MHINDLKTDLKDGVALLNLLEIISGKPIGKRWNKNPRVPNQKYENNQIAIEFVQAEGLKLVNIGTCPNHESRSLFVSASLLLLHAIRSSALATRNFFFLWWLFGRHLFYIAQCGSPACLLLACEQAVPTSPTAT